MKAIIGYGGGGKGGGGSSGATIAEDSLASRAYAQVVDLISEGEIQGLVDGMKSVYLNGTPLQNADGSYNFTGVSFDSRNGTQSQSFIPGFSDVEAEISVGVEVRQTQALVRRVTSPNVDAVRIRVLVPQLSLQNTSSGSVTGTQVDLAIDIQSNNGGYVTYATDTISGKATNQYERSYRIRLPAGGPWDIRVRRITPDSTQSNLVNKFRWESYTEIVDSKLSYPNSAIVAMSVDSAQFQSVPTRAYDVKLLKIRIPSNYDPIARTYTGTWDGTFQVAWSDNPAWCFYDMLTSQRYGLGQFVSQSQVDKWSIYAIAQYCDGMVPNGYGGLEPRFTCNLYIQSYAAAFQVMQDMASIFRGMAFWSSGNVSAVQDAPSDPVALFSNSNVIEGNFVYSGSSLKARHTVALVTWNNPADLYKPYVEYVEDKDGIARYGVIQTRITAMGCTSRGQANRVGRWLLYSERLETESVVFRTGINAVPVRPGDVIKVADQVRAGQRLGGRVHSGTTTTVTLDSPLVDSTGASVNPAGGTMSVIMADGSVQNAPIASMTGNVVSLSTPLTAAPQNAAMWIIELPTLSSQLFRVIQVTEAEQGQFEITALAHNNTKYGSIENNLTLETRTVTSLKVNVPPPIQLSISQSLYLAQAQVMMTATFSWNKAAGANGYRVGYTIDGGNWVYVTAQSNSFDLTATVPGNYKVRVWSLNSVGAVGTQYTEASQLLLGKYVPPSAVTNFYATRNGDVINFTWTPAPDVDIANYEIRYGTVWTTATPVGSSSSNSYSFTSKRGGSFLIRALSTSTIYSATDAAVVVADNAGINVVLSYDDGAAHFPGTLSSAVNIGTGIVPTNGSPWSAHTLPWTSYTQPWGMGDAGPSGSYTTNAIDSGVIATSVVTLNPTVIVYTVPQPWNTYTQPWNTYAAPTWTWLGLQSAISASFQISTSLDNITWSAFQPFAPGSYNFRYVKIKVTLLTTNLTYLPELTGLVVNIDVPDRVDHYKNTVISAAGTTITFSKPFVGIQTVQTTLQSGNAGDTVMVTAKFASSVTIKVYNIAGTAVTGIVDVDVFGYGAVG